MKKSNKRPDPHKPLTNAEFKKLKPVRGIGGLPKAAQKAIKASRGRPPVENPKERVTIRLDADVIHQLRKSGDGWQTRLNEAVRQWLHL